MSQVILIAGIGSYYGTGHLVRQQALRDILAAQGREVSLFLHRADLPKGRLEIFAVQALEGAANIPVSQTLAEVPRPVFVVDARDVDISNLLDYGPVITLDNQCSKRGRLEGPVLFWDTIPHPNVDISVSLRQFLIAPSLNSLASSVEKERGNALLYTGDYVNEKRLKSLIQKLRQSSIRSITLVGRMPMAGANLRCHERLDPPTFHKALHAAEYFFSYYGMSIFEGMYLGTKPVLYGNDSQVHDDLSRYICQAVGIPFLARPEELSESQFQNALEQSAAVSAAPSGDGYGLLVKKILSLL